MSNRLQNKKSHKILFLDNTLDVGGQEKLLYDFLSRIDRGRFDAVICCLKRGGYLKDAFKKLGFGFYEELLSHKYDALAYRKVSRILAKEKVDLIHSFIHPNTVFFSHMAMLTRSVKAWVLAIHASGSPAGGRLIGRFQKLFLSRVSRYVALADAHKRYLVDVEGLPEKKIDVINNGVDVDKFHPGPSDPDFKKGLGISEGEQVVTTVASLNRRKRIDLLLQSASIVLEKRRHVRFLIVGGGPERNRLEHLTRYFGIEKNVTFTGIRDDTPAILRASDLFVLASMRGTETFPLVLLEAMASGLPVVSTDVGSVRELVVDGESAIVVPPENAEALAQAIEILLTNEEKARVFGMKGREVAVERFTLDQMSIRMERLYEHVLSRSRRAD